MTDARKNPLGWPTWLWGLLLAWVLVLEAYTAAGVAGLAFAFDALRAFEGFCALVMGGFGALLLVRHLRHRAAALLGLILVAIATQVTPDLGPVTIIPDPAKLLIIIPVIIVRSACVGYFWPPFSLEISGGPASRRQGRFVQTLAAVFAVMPIAAIAAGPLAGLISLSAMIWTTLIVGNQLLGYWILARNYRRNDAAGRNRIKIVFAAFVLLMISGLAAVAAAIAQARSVAPAVPGFALAGTALLAYAVLRRNLFDFGFVLNRTLVYATVSFILLAAFGLAEWGIERIVPEAWHNGGPFISAGVALALFLSFHRLRDWVERHVERLFFNSWHVNEAALRRFVGAAGHFDTSPALCRGFAEELSRFAYGAGAALYLRRAGGGYRLAAGRLSAGRRAYADEDRAIALMRAERRPVDIALAHSSFPGVLVLPMLDQSTLAGFILLDRKPDGTDYRPDEVDVLGWAASQVGFALQAQHARELEAEVAGMATRLAVVAEDRDRLRAMLAGPAIRDISPMEEARSSAA